MDSREQEARDRLIKELFTAFPYGMNKERIAYYVKTTNSIALSDLTAAVTYAALNWDQKGVPPIAMLRRWAGQAATTRAGQRVEAPRARDVALARLKDRGLVLDDQSPDEFFVWLEFMHFPYILGRYQGPASKETQLAFVDRVARFERERDTRIYGRVLPGTEQRLDEFMLLVDPVKEDRRFAVNRPEPPMTPEEIVAIWERQLELARSEGADENAKRIKFLERGVERARAKAGGQDPGPWSDDILQSIE